MNEGLDAHEACGVVSVLLLGAQLAKCELILEGCDLLWAGLGLRNLRERLSQDSIALYYLTQNGQLRLGALSRLFVQDGTCLAYLCTELGICRSSRKIFRDSGEVHALGGGMRGSERPIRLIKALLYVIAVVAVVLLRCLCRPIESLESPLESIPC